MTATLPDFRSPIPWALARFADGELAVMEGRKIAAADGWDAQGVSSAFRDALCASLEYLDVGYRVGVACPSCDPLTHSSLMYRRKYHADTLLSDIFVNANYDAFLTSIEGLGVHLVASYPQADPRFRTHPQLINQPDCLDRIDDIVWQLCRPTLCGPIFVAAGPASCVIVHRYWQRAHNPQTVVDIGSTLDPHFLGRYTRGYHDPSHPNRRKVCSWTPAAT